MGPGVCLMRTRMTTPHPPPSPHFYSPLRKKSTRSSFRIVHWTIARAHATLSSNWRAGIPESRPADSFLILMVKLRHLQQIPKTGLENPRHRADLALLYHLGVYLFVFSHELAIDYRHYFHQGAGQKCLISREDVLFGH